MVDSDDPKRGELNLLRRELKYLESLGSRPTGSPAHQALVEDIAIKLTAMGWRSDAIRIVSPGGSPLKTITMSD